MAGQPLSEVSPECSWAAQELLSIWKDCTNHLEKCLWDFLVPKRMVPLQTMNIDSLPIKGKNDVLSRMTVTEINVFRLLRGLYAIRKEFNLRFYFRGKPIKSWSFSHWCLQLFARAFNVSKTVPLLLVRKDSLCDDYKWKDWIICAAESLVTGRNFSHLLLLFSPSSFGLFDLTVALTGPVDAPEASSSAVIGKRRAS